MLKLGTYVVDRTTKQNGMLTHMQMEQNGNVYYSFQPRGLNPKTGEPLDIRWLVDTNIEGSEYMPTPDIQLEVLGSIATDMASGYTGHAVCLRLHLNGCVHVTLQSCEILSETGTVPLAVDFDIRRLSGEKIKSLTVEELDESKLETPSPIALKRGPARHVCKEPSHRM